MRYIYIASEVQEKEMVHGGGGAENCDGLERRIHVYVHTASQPG